jgi:hypothetical protein
VSVDVAAVVSLRWEIWKSMLTMLRSYSALAGLNDGVAIKVIPAEAEQSDSVFFESRHATLSLSFQPASGNGTWTLRERDGKVEHGSLKKLGFPRLGTFVMVEDGSLFMKQEFVELDMMSIDLVARLVAFEHAVEGWG